MAIVRARAGFCKRAAVLALVLATTIAAAGCGGDDQRDVEAWANSACGAMSGWITDVNEAVGSLTDSGLAFDEDDIRDAVNQTRDATDELADDLQDLGRPETDDGQQVEEELDTLRATLREQVDRVEQAVEEDKPPLELATVVSSALALGADQLQKTFDTLRGLDPGGELNTAFENADECDSLQQQVADIGS